MTRNGRGAPGERSKISSASAPSSSVASRRSRWTGELFVNSARAHLDNADDKIVFDRYHVMGYLNKAVDTVRKQENRALVAQGDKTLSGSKYLWLYGAENVPAKHESRFAALRDTNLKTGRCVSSLLRQFLIQFSEPATSFTGWLIHATVGSAGGVGILRTNRSG